ncbi:MAG TPA: hypothetical protein VGG74_34360 [Kofleriaceae bacterium]|jgi:hypothetical protein
MRLAGIALVLAGCSSFDANGIGGDGAVGNNDAAGGCTVTIALTPTMPVVGDHVHAAAVVSGLVGVPTYSWTVDGSASVAYEAPDGSAIGFDVPVPATHEIDLSITGTTSYCAPASTTFDVVDGSGATALYRMRVLPPPGVAAPFEGDILVRAGTSLTRDVPLDPGEDLPGSVTSGAIGVPAYLQFVPASGPPIEAFSAMTTGAFDTHVALATYQVIVVPEIPGLAPRGFAWSPSQQATFAVDAGQPIAGTVTVGGSPLAGAQVQLASSGVPSTIATTAADGSFSVLASFGSGAAVTVSVVPPATSGLARMSASTTLAPPLAIAYSAATPCDLAGATIQRGGVAQPGAQVTIVGGIGTVGTIGGTQASGAVLATVTANGTGVLPSVPVPRAAGLHAIVQIASNDLAVATLDTSACSVSTIAAPAEVANAGTVAAGSAALANARVEATPAGSLALATLVPVDATTGSDGSFMLLLASGATYDVRVADPRGAPFGAIGVSSVPATIALAPPLVISGTISVLGGPGTVTGAAVEVLCASCSGVDAERPIAQAASDAQGHYQLTVADPSSM